MLGMHILDQDQPGRSGRAGGSVSPTLDVGAVGAVRKFNLVILSLSILFRSCVNTARRQDTDKTQTMAFNCQVLSDLARHWYIYFCYTVILEPEISMKI